jgi:hypothetical protein
MSRLTSDESERLIFMDHDPDTLAAMRDALPALRALYDNLEGKLIESVETRDRAKLLLCSWSYGRVAALVTDIETTLGP